MLKISNRSASMTSLRHHALFGAVAVTALIVGLGGWAGMTQIAGAVVATGVTAVEGGSRKVQHPEGGVVTEILVKDDDRVEAGQLLVQLDDVEIQSSLDVVLSQAREAIARLSRLTAESLKAPAMEMPLIVGNWPEDPILAEQFASQDNLRLSRKATLDGQVGRLQEQISQQERQIEGLQSQQVAVEQQLELLGTDGERMAKLLDEQLIESSRVTELARERSQLEGEQGRIVAAIASAEASISDLELQRTQTADDFMSEVLTELQTTNQVVAELLQKKVAAEDRLRRIQVRAPLSGIVHESVVQTIGGVVGAGETLMLIVPEESRLLIDTRIGALDIDKLHVDQEVIVRMSGLDARKTPELAAAVEAISPDLTTDPTTGAQYYAVRVDVLNAELSKLPDGIQLVPGMPAQAFIQTGERTVLSYLLHPITEQMTQAFRED